MKIMKKLLAVVMVMVLVISLLPAAVVNANVPITVTIDGQAVQFVGQGPVVVGGRTLVPARGVFELLGFVVAWDGAIQQVTLTSDSHVVVLTIGSATFTTNGVGHTLDAPAQVMAGSTMLPLRAVIESIGHSVGWDGATQTVLITTAASLLIQEPTPPQPPEEATSQPPEVQPPVFAMAQPEVIPTQTGQRPPIAPATWAEGVSLTTHLTNTPVANALRVVNGNLMVSLRVASENLLGTEPGWIGPDQPVTLTGFNAVGQPVTLVITVNSPEATITVDGISRVVDIATEVARLTGAHGSDLMAGSITPVVVGGSLHVPLHFVLLTFEIPFRWDADLNAVRIAQ